MAYCYALPGGAAFLRLHTVKLRDINNRTYAAVHFFRDLTYERRMLENLNRSESMYRAITDFAGVGIMLFRKEAIIYLNERMLSIMGVQGPEIGMDDFAAWIHPDDRRRVYGRLKKLFDKKPVPARFEFRGLPGEGMRYYSGYAQVIDYEEQPTIHFIVDDITAQKELEEKARINELRLYHEDRLTALGVMAAGIAHELNQPLNTLSVITDGLLFGRDEGWDLDREDLFENMEMISRQIIRMSEVIRNIRDFSREDRVQTEDAVHLNEAVDNVFLMIGRQLEAHGIQVDKRFEPGLPQVIANLNRMEQVIMNLIVNARQALDECGKKRKEIRVHTTNSNGCVTLEVADNATGIEEGTLSKVFDPFFTTKEVGKGTGLGLSISQSILSEFRGRIEVFNNDRGGATFRVTLPSAGDPS